MEFPRFTSCLIFLILCPIGASILPVWESLDSCFLFDVTIGMRLLKAGELPHCSNSSLNRFLSFDVESSSWIFRLKGLLVMVFHWVRISSQLGQRLTKGSPPENAHVLLKFRPMQLARCHHFEMGLICWGLAQQHSPGRGLD